MSEVDAISSTSTTPRATVHFAARFWRLTLKELRETLRDRRTIVTLVLMPVLVYPVLGIALQQFALSGNTTGGEVIWRIAAEDLQTLRQFHRMLDLGDDYLRAQEEHAPPLPLNPSRVGSLAQGGTASADRGGGMRAVPPAHNRPKIELFHADNIDEQLRALDIDLGVRRAPPGEIDEDNPDMIEFQLQYRANMPLSEEVAHYVEERLRAYNARQLRNRLRQLGEPTDARVGWQWAPVFEKNDSGFSMAALAPIVLILMTITGAVYPAIDLTAGERERGTLESLMAAPVPRLSLLGAKYVAVLTVAMLTAVANLTAMSITLRGTGLGEALLGPRGLSLGVLGITFLLLALFATFFSAVLLAITSFARSFKEAQAYLIPLMLLSLGPGFISVMPGLKLGGLLTVAPLINIVLLARDVMQGTAQGLPATIAVISTALYAVAALALAAKIFGSDSVLYGSEGSWSDVFARPDAPQERATVGGAWLTAAIVYPLYFAAMGLLGGLKQAPAVNQIVLAGLCTVTVFALVPWLVARRQRLVSRSGFQLSPPSVLSLLGAALLGFSLWPIAHELFVFAQQLGLGTISQDTLRGLAPQVEQQLEAWRKQSPLLILAAFALAPAICEEFFFRGYLLGALKSRWPAWAAIAATAALFGVFHLSVGGIAAMERVITSTFLGLVLGWLCWQAGSIWPGVVTHTLHNGLLLSLGYWKDRLPFGEQATDSGHLPIAWVASAAAVAAVGLTLVYSGRRKANSRNVASST